jgi:hypothetical protein
MRSQEYTPLISGMNSVENLESFILDLRALNICKNETEIEKAMQTTMYDSSSESQADFSRKAIESLVSKKLVTVCFSKPNKGCKSINVGIF